MDREKVVLEEVMESARRIVIRLDVGSFQLLGPRHNVLSVESQVAFATVVNELYKEGYRLVGPAEYAGAYGVSLDSVYCRVYEEGALFLLQYQDDERRSEAVPLEEREVIEGLGRHLD